MISGHFSSLFVRGQHSFPNLKTQKWSRRLKITWLMQSSFMFCRKHLGPYLLSIPASDEICVSAGFCSNFWNACEDASDSGVHIPYCGQATANRGWLSWQMNKLLGIFPFSLTRVCSEKAHPSQCWSNKTSRKLHLLS